MTGMHYKSVACQKVPDPDLSHSSEPFITWYLSAEKRHDFLLLIQNLLLKPVGSYHCRALWEM